MKNFTRSLTLALALLMGITAGAVTPMSSLPSATATIFLDFDGHRVSGSLWNNGNPINCEAAPLTDAQILEIFNRVSEDYRPFNVNITTDSVKFLAAPLTQRIRVIVTPTSSWKTGVGGISYIGSFTWGDDTPAFVFSDRLGPNSPKYIAECCTHESGHSLGLSHQSAYDNNCNLVETYNTGSGSGEIGWAPVMGNSYYKNMTGWNDGPTPYGCASVQDNLTTITSLNGFTYRNDDFSETLDASAYSLGANAFSVDGIISTSTDKDAFRFTALQNITLHIDAKPFSVSPNTNIGSNLDIKISLYDASQNLLRIYDPSNTMSIGIDTSLHAGTYYFVIDGTGNANTDNYGSLGSYKITGFMNSLPIHDVSLQGRSEKNTHQLNWNIISDEPIASQIIEYSTDGRVFKTLSQVPAGSHSFSYMPLETGTIYYRLGVTSAVNQSVQSNVIALKNGSPVKKNVQVSNLVHNEMSIQSLERYRYRLFDNSGRALATGSGNIGFNRIDMSRYPSGLYIIQIQVNNELYSERIVKQ